METPESETTGRTNGFHLGLARPCEYENVPTPVKHIRKSPMCA